MAKATEQTAVDTSTTTTDTTDTAVAPVAPTAPAPQLRAQKAAPHPWDRHKTVVNGLTIYTKASNAS